MVIYLPLYLLNEIGLTWTEIGPIFTFMLLPFILFELPAGRLADKYFGEKEMLILGFIICGTATFFVALGNSPSIMYWALVLFCTRVGAALIEIMTESYFFKHVNADNTDLISLYRLAMPITSAITPIAVFVLRLFMPLSATAYVLAAVLFCGSLPILFLQDTK